MTYSFLNRRQLLALGAILPVIPRLAQAQAPTKIVVPFTPGTTPDTVARLLAPRLNALLSNVFVIENKAGASGMIGMGSVAKAAPDGATLLLGTSTALTLPFVYRSVPFDVLEGFTPISMLGYTNFALAVHPSIPARNLTELRQWVEQQNSQSLEVDYASPGNGTFQHLCMEWLAQETGMKLKHVTYRGTAPAIADLVGGHVKLMFIPMHLALPMAKDGRLVLLGSTRKQPETGQTGLEPIAAQGIPNFDAEAWYAVWGPANMPNELVARYSAAFDQALQDPEVKESMANQGVTTRQMSPAELEALAKSEQLHWAELIKKINFQIE